MKGIVPTGSVFIIRSYEWIPAYAGMTDNSKKKWGLNRDLFHSMGYLNFRKYANSG